MVVLKFGGTSVANAQNIKLAIQIIENKVKNNQLIVVVSALSGVTDMLINTSNKAASKDESYKKNLEEIKQKHIETISNLISIKNQKLCLKLLKLK